MNKDNCMTLWNSAGDICTVLEFAITPQQFAQLLPTDIDNPDSNGKHLEMCELTSVITGKFIKLISMNEIPELQDVKKQSSKGNPSENKVFKHSSFNQERQTPPERLLNGPCTQEITDCQIHKLKKKQCASSSKVTEQKLKIIGAPPPTYGRNTQSNVKSENQTKKN